MDKTSPSNPEEDTESTDEITQDLPDIQADDSTDDTPDDSTNASAEDFEELLVDDLEEGTGDEVKDGDTVSVHYTGTLINGEKFDSSVDRGTPFEFTVGQGSVIQGWDQGLLGMKIGGKRKLSIPSSLGYGATGSPPTIPGGAGLVFEIELLEIK